MALSKETTTNSTNKDKLLYIKSKPCLVDIALIKGAGFYIDIKYKDNKFFIISLYKIDYIINKKDRNIKTIDETKEEIFKRIILKEYHDFIKAFF